MNLLELYLKQRSVSTDTRTLKPGDIYFALHGETFDGNRFAGQALESGASWVVADDPAVVTSDRILLVPDTLQALQQLARDYRSTWTIPVIGITGTNGKTTTKELIAAVLAKKYSVQATKGNLNNHIGVPLTILSVAPETQIAIVEMGANHPGEIAFLAEIARPETGIITNIGKAHLEGFGSFQGVINTKNELFDHIRSTGGTAVVNADDRLLTDLSKGMNRILYGTGTNVSGNITDPDFLVRFQLVINADKFQVHTNLAGSYNLDNLLAAAAFGHYYGVPGVDIARALEEYQPTLNRSQMLTAGSNTILMDAYNANPSSMAASILNFRGIRAGRKVIILGDMFELGNDAAAEHEKILDLAIESGFDEILLAGEHFCETAAGKTARCFETTNALGEYLKAHRIENSHILIKGSRGMKMELITEMLNDE